MVPWATHRPRAEFLRERYPFAAEVLTLYLALLDVWATDDRPEPDRIVGWTVEHVLPHVVKATEAAGPESLAAACRALMAAGRLDESLALWLAGDELPPVDRYLARASLRPALQFRVDQGQTRDISDTDLARLSLINAVGSAGCPKCGGPPQLSFRAAAADRLVSGRRHLLCARCGQSWSYSGSACPSCGETSGSRRTVYAEPRGGSVVRGLDDEPTAGTPTFPHLRVDACASCMRYLIDVDMGRDPRAVPEVDELAALPLDLYATEHGLSKITPNLMGF